MGTENAGSENDGTETGSEGTGNAGSSTSANEQGQGSANGQGPDAKDAEIERLRGEIRKFRNIEDRLKKALPKAQGYDELRTSLMTEQEKAEEARKTLQQERDAALQEASARSAEMAILKAAVKHGLAEEDTVFLKGITDPAEIDTQAKKLAARIQKANTPNFDGGARGGSSQSTMTMGDLLQQQIDRARGFTR